MTSLVWDMHAVTFYMHVMKTQSLKTSSESLGSNDSKGPKKSQLATERHQKVNR